MAHSLYESSFRALKKNMVNLCKRDVVHCCSCPNLEAILVGLEILNPNRSAQPKISIGVAHHYFRTTKMGVKAIEVCI
jgi:hypothetical protein